MITLPIVEEAITELEWVLEHHAKIILVRPAPANGLRGPRSIALPEFDPFWARVQEADIPVAMHASFAPLTSYYETWEPGNSDSAFKPTPLKELLLQHREIEDAIAAMICVGALSRFPDLRILSVENGANLGRPPAAPTRLRVPEDTAGVRRTPGGGLPAKRLREPVLGG